MSTSPDTRTRADDRLVTLISRWLARHLSNEELRAGLEEADPAELSREQVEALDELRAALDEHPRRARDGRARDAEALALGG